MLRASGYFLVLAPVFFIFLSIFRNNDSFINLGSVFRNHFGLFKNCRVQFVIFYILPIFIAAGLTLLFKISQDFCENINIVVSIIISMLFAICSIIGTKDYSSLEKTKNSENISLSDLPTESISENADNEIKQKKIKKVARETFDAIVVTTFIALVLIFICLASIAIDIFTKSALLISIATFIVYYFLGITILNLLLIIKRMEKLFVAML